ncbi:hypothetical protein GCM10029992_11390 [Glycomyces albus]
MGRHATKAGEASRAEARPPLPYPVSDGRVAPTAKAAMERRSQRRRSRLAALSAAAMLTLGGAAGVGMAMADESEAGAGDGIVFSGGCGTLGLLSPTSKPDSSELSVPKGSQVSYTNDLGAAAELHVGGEVYDIGKGSTQVFVMNQSAEIAMVPECAGLFADYESAQVHVTAPVEGDEPEPDSGGGTTAELPAPDDGGEAPAQDSGDEPAASGSTPQDGSGVAQGDQPSAEEQGPSDEASESAGDEEINAFGPSDDEQAAGDDPFAPAGGEEEVAAVDPKAVSDGASGLLALVAIVCLVGVSAAVMRTILKQRVAA